MQNEKVNMYPTTIEELKIKIDYILKNDKNETLHNYLKDWLKWIDTTNFKLQNKIEGKYYLRASSLIGKRFALQLWEKKGEYNVLVYNIITNYYSEYNNENTICIINKED